MMKKLFGLLVLALLLNGCDDGELTVENIDFTDVSANHCGNIVYKLKDTEVLFFEVESYESAFINDATPEGEPILLEVNDENRIFYRSYNGEITQDNICETIQPTTPTVGEEWEFTGGMIEITTTPVIIPNTELTGGEIIQKYRHTIIFRNTTRNGLLGDYPFGDYLTDAVVLPFNFDSELANCDNVIVNTNGSEGIALTIDPALIDNAVTPVGSPRTGLIDGSTNKLIYSLFQSQVTADYFCTMPTPATPILREQWIADNGVSGISGIIEVTTTTGGGPGVFQHEIHLKNVRLRRGNSSFLLATDYLLGTLTL